MAIPKQHQIQGTKALEMAMRDVMDSLEDSLCCLGYQPLSDCMEILSIEAPSETLARPQPQRAEVHTLFSHPGNSLVDYLIAREEKLPSMSA